MEHGQANNTLKFRRQSGETRSNQCILFFLLFFTNGDDVKDHSSKYTVIKSQRTQRQAHVL